MRLNGKVTYNNGVWAIDAKPHIRMILKRMFKSIDSKSFVLTFHHTGVFAEDLEWFLLRYPMEIDSELHEFLKREADRSRSKIDEVEKLLIDPGAINATLALPLREYQVQAVQISKKLQRLLIADDIGLGKTATSIGVFADPDNLPALVVCKSHLCTQWAAQIKKFAPNLTTHIVKSVKPYSIKASVLIISYHKIHGWVDALSDKVKTIVFDEAQELRHDGTIKYNTAWKMVRSTNISLALTATPVFNYGVEVFNILDLLSEGCLGDRGEFLQEWCEFTGTKWVAREPIALGSFLRSQYLMIRRTRKDVGRELPPIQKMVETVSYNEKIMDILKADALQLAKMILSQNGSFMERGQIAREFDLKLRQATGIAKAPFVAELISSMVEGGNKVVLCGWHREVYRIWEEGFKNSGVKYWLYTGSETSGQKEKSVKEFVECDKGVLILSLRSGDGLDGLQDVCNIIVFGELDWTPAVMDQCTGRLARDGQTQSVLALYLVSEAGSDPTMARLLGLKAEQMLGITDMKAPTDIVPEQFEESRITELAQDFIKNYSK